ncbi:MAG TPA: hypothetical protein DCK99_13420 [Blastocatellia bacterium]|jgi:hypothetical protein|nr:hypothetical protein [Blastocatellia bacterium]
MSIDRCSEVAGAHGRTAIVTISGIAVGKPKHLRGNSGLAIVPHRPGTARNRRSGSKAEWGEGHTPARSRGDVLARQMAGRLRDGRIASNGSPSR